MNGTQSAEHAAILGRLTQYHAAMVDGHTDVLEGLLEPDFELVHITGYVQPKREWFAVIRGGKFDYHAIELDKDSLVVELPASQSVATATLRGKGIFDATINGFKSPWRLQFTIHWTKSGNQWRLVRARYSSY